MQARDTGPRVSRRMQDNIVLDLSNGVPGQHPRLRVPPRVLLARLEPASSELELTSYCMIISMTL